jgi:hypothetical protein
MVSFLLSRPAHSQSLHRLGLIISYVNSEGYRPDDINGISSRISCNAIKFIKPNIKLQINVLRDVCNKLVCRERMRMKKELTWAAQSTITAITNFAAMLFRCSSCWVKNVECVFPRNLPASLYQWHSEWVHTNPAQLSTHGDTINVLKQIMSRPWWDNADKSLLSVCMYGLTLLVIKSVSCSRIEKQEMP